MRISTLDQINIIRTDITLGGSNYSFIVETADFELYIVKPHNPINDRWQAPNELLAGLLGRAINGPFIEPHLVYLDEELLEVSGLRRREIFAYRTLKPGIGFSLKYYENSLQGTLPESEIQQLINPGSSIAILLLDSWMNNIDRNNIGNLIFVAHNSLRKSKARQMYAIDQGLVFGGLDWLDEALQHNKSRVIVEDRLHILDRLARKYSKSHLEYF